MTCRHDSILVFEWKERYGGYLTCNRGNFQLNVDPLISPVSWSCCVKYGFHQSVQLEYGECGVVELAKIQAENAYFKAIGVER